MMQDWYDKMVKALQLNGKGERSQSRLGGTLCACSSTSIVKPPINPNPSREVSAQKHPKSLSTLLLLPGGIAQPAAATSSLQTRNQKALPYMQSLSRSGLLESRLKEGDVLDLLIF